MRFEPLHPAVLKTFDPRPAAAVGQVLASVGHRGKYLLLRLGGTGGAGGAGALTFVVHLMQAGRLRIDTQQVRKPRGGMARWTFADGPALLLAEAGTERRAGVWLVAGDSGEAKPLARLGPDGPPRPAPGRGQRARPRLLARPVASGRYRAAAGQRGAPLGWISRDSTKPAPARRHRASSSGVCWRSADVGRSDRPNDVHHRPAARPGRCGQYRRYRVARDARPAARCWPQHHQPLRALK